MTIPNVRKFYDNRFNQVNPGRMDWKFWAARQDDPPPKPEEKYTLPEAQEKLKADGFMVMKQEAFNNILDEKFGKGYNKGKTEAEGSLTDEQKKWKADAKEVETLRAKVADLEKDKPDMISKSEHEQLLKIEQDKNKTSEDKIASLRNLQRDNEILKVIGSKTVDADAVLALTRDKFAIDDEGKVYPINEKGERLIDNGGPVDISRYYDGFFKEKAYLAKASDSTGAGSGTTSEGKPTTGGGKYSIDQLADMSDEEFAKVGGIASLGS